VLHILGLVKSLADDLLGKSRTSDDAAQEEEKTRPRTHGDEEGTSPAFLAASSATARN
jgi:hypothetical protein